jgi:hypothetical protein
MVLVSALTIFGLRGRQTRKENDMGLTRGDE